MTSDGVQHPGVVELPRLTSVRAFAAFAVFAFHGYLFAYSRPSEVFRAGYAGVSLFFVLSGFVLTWATRPTSSARTFYRRRFARIYPSYLAAFLFAALLAPWPSGPSVLASVTLTQAWWPVNFYVLNPPGWSLSAEAFFYAAFPLIVARLRVLDSRRVVQVALGWWAVTNAATVVLSRTDMTTTYSQPILRSGEFVLGVTAALLMQRGWRPPVRTRTALALVVAALVPATLVPYPLANVVLGVPFAALLVCLARDDLAGAPGWIKHPSLIFAGRVSFAFYLLHMPILVFCAKHTSASKATAVGFVASAALAVLLHYAVELPFQAWLAGTRSRSRRPAAAAAASPGRGPDA